MNTAQLLRPEWLAVLPIALVWLALFWLQRKADGGWAGQVDAHLLPSLLSHPVQVNRLEASMVFCLAVIASIALAGPSLSRSEVPLERDSRARVFLLDMSRSMDATDLRPTRMAQARLKLLDLLEQSRDRPVALIGFAAYPYTLTPITDDTNTLRLIVPLIQSNMAPAQGADIDAALAHAHALVAQTHVREGDLILISDSEPSNSALQRARALREAGFKLSVVSVGGTSAVEVPHGLGVLTGRDDNAISVEPAHASLQKLAAAGGGEHVALGSGATSVTSVLDTGDAGRATAHRRSTVLSRDDGAWLLWLALVPIMVIARRGVLV